MGVINFFMQIDSDTLAAMSESQRAIVAGRSAWATGAFAIAVLSGSAGWLLPLAQEVGRILFVHCVAHRHGRAHDPLPWHFRSTTNLGPMEISMFIALPLAVAAFLLWYAKQAQSKGLIR